MSKKDDAALKAKLKALEKSSKKGKTLFMRKLALELCLLCWKELIKHGYRTPDEALTAPPGSRVSVPLSLLALMITALRRPPAPRGRRRTGTTEEALKLLEEEAGSVRHAAKIIALRSGEPLERVRSRIRNTKRKKKR